MRGGLPIGVGALLDELAGHAEVDAEELTGVSEHDDALRHGGGAEPEQVRLAARAEPCSLRLRAVLSGQETDPDAAAEPLHRGRRRGGGARVAPALHLDAEPARPGEQGRMVEERVRVPGVHHVRVAEGHRPRRRRKLRHERKVVRRLGGQPRRDREREGEEQAGVGSHGSHRGGPGASGNLVPRGRGRQ